MKTSQLTLLVAAVAGTCACVGACTTPQARTECNPAASSYLAGTNNFWAKYTLKAGTGACAELPGDEVGFQRYLTPGSKEPTFAVRTQRMGDVLAGVTYLADSDRSNDCLDEADCGQCESSSTNPCQLVPDPVYRSDPADPSGKKANGIGYLTLFPDSDGICDGSGITEAIQNFQAESVPLVDGGTEEFPAVNMSYKWSNLKVTSTAAVPGTVFTADLSYVEGTCKATYSVVGIWPRVDCKTDEDCNPVANVDAGRVFGSGLSPDFVPVCNVDVGVCEASVDPVQLR
jgi:hypothetical protein